MYALYIIKHIHINDQQKITCEVIIIISRWRNYRSFFFFLCTFLHFPVIFEIFGNQGKFLKIKRNVSQNRPLLRRTTLQGRHACHGALISSALSGMFFLA